MGYLAQAIHLAREQPLLGIGVAAAVIAIALLLNRKPRLQRDADERLAAIRREKSDQYTKLRPPH